MNKDNINMSSPYQFGYLEIIIGSMYSGKTSRLVDIYKQCKFCNISVTVINHTIDNRYDDELLSTHDKVKIPCMKTERLLDLWTESIDLKDDIEIIPRSKDKCKIKISEVILFNAREIELVNIKYCKLGYVPLIVFSRLLSIIHT